MLNRKIRVKQMTYEDSETECKIIMPLFDFRNKDEVEYAFLDGRYILQRFEPKDELTKEKGFSEKDRTDISFARWAIFVDNAEKYNYQDEVNILLLALRLAKKCRAFIKFRLSPNCRKRISRISNTIQFTIMDDTTRIIESSDLDKADEIFKKLIDMRMVSSRTHNAVLFLYKAYHSSGWMDAFIYYMMCLESLFSKERKGDSEKTICLRVSVFLNDKYGTKYDDIQPLYELRSKLVHGSFALNEETPPGVHLARLKKLEDLMINVFQLFLDQDIHKLYGDLNKKEEYFNELSRTKAHL
ncbi:hypothetical protein LCGC14_2321490, partial [marine sediment metagenome]